MKTTEERFWAKVEKTDGCWLWAAALSSDGYGSFWHDGAKSAHRVAYELLRGPIPDGMSLDHLCRTAACVNPEHLEPVTHQVNCLRGVSVVALNAVKTECRHGHPFDDRNTYVDKRGKRECRECKRLASRRYLAGRKEQPK